MSYIRTLKLRSLELQSTQTLKWLISDILCKATIGFNFSDTEAVRDKTFSIYVDSVSNIDQFERVQNVLTHLLFAKETTLIAHHWQLL